ncbi:ferrochelatase [Paenibacillus radicis (ex Xue et al. 2023)]|uniref:Coproporphyrin III ferrochelatase n=1 Tax=Paenibacillus radicis (ex Xue et al. 2023) TaxID=2972489 RepID=A0ABT1Y8U3_9BACL|nr:ferrochelatase [Paenibacillus radicis (ex Xue et al. 2023)]MCR8629612.1 ferrochelatase [Paenibacillus radicis (ex Xue et al. 2023)]
MSKQRIGVLVMSYGTPESLDQVEAYYTHIRRGHPPTPEQLKDLTDRYEAIVGGFFPLRENTNKQVQALEDRLNADHPDISFTCYQGLKHAVPYIEDGVEQMVKDGIEQAVGVVLAPHYSTMSVGGYIKRAQDKAAESGLQINFVKSYHLHPQLLEALSQRITDTLTRFGDTSRDEVRIVFTAHSLPEKILEMKDPYPEQLLETSRAIAAQTGISNWQFGWQSAGQTGTPWLGPDILDVLQTISSEKQFKHVLVCPIGFVSDHLEVLYDLDIEAQKTARELGIHLERTPSLNTDPLYMGALSDVVYAQCERK